MNAPLDVLLEPLLDRLAELIVTKLAEGSHANMIDQVGSPLGRRRHIEAVRGLVARGALGAAIVGRRHMLSRDALAAELAKATGGTRPARKQAPVDQLAAVRERYGYERKGAA